MGWFASGKAKQERATAERVLGAVPGSLRRIHECEEAARRIYVRSVQEQQARDATEIPGLSAASLRVLRDVRTADLANQDGRREERYEDRERRREKAVAAAWNGGRADPRVAGELDRFMAAASRRLGEEGEREALRSAHSGRDMKIPGVGRDRQAELDAMARSFAVARTGRELSAGWARQVEQEAKEVAQWQARQEERERRGLPREPEQERERQRQTRGLGLGR